MIRIGLCGSPEDAARAKVAGCDYVELNFAKTARMSEAEFARLIATLEEAGIRAEALNSFIPAEFRLCKLKGTSELRAYLKQGFERAHSLGAQVVVFGSAGARKLPRRVPKAEGWAILAPYCRLAAQLGAQAGVAVAVEPLCYAECNAVNTLREGLALARLADHPNLKLLADMYHMGENGEEFADIKLAADALAHCHIGRPGGRTWPMPGDGYDYGPFFAALKSIGYAGRLSIEAAPVNGPEDLAVSVAYLRELAVSLRD